MYTPRFKKSSGSLAATLAFCGTAGTSGAVLAQTAAEPGAGDTVLPAVEVKASADASSGGLPASMPVAKSPGAAGLGFWAMSTTWTRPSAAPAIRRH